ncbi:MAG: N-acetyltransferase [Acidobacteria bacterium]|nr:N-acetyltransferase [Acidobacteriota bacterium]
MPLIRDERPEDQTAVRFVNELAFGRADEADLVDTLRSSCPDALSRVAIDGDTVVGHIMFTPVVIDGHGGLVAGMGLGPMAVLPSHQGQDIGTALVRHGIEELRMRACPFVVVVGHPAYYPRFGFELASRRGLRSQWPGMPDEAFMVIVLDEGTMKGVTGVARYRGEFDAVT